MCPYLKIGSLNIPMYSLLGAAGILLGWLFAWLRGRRSGMDPDDCAFSYMYGFIGALAGAKLLPILLNIPAMVSDLSLLTTDLNAFAAKYLSQMVFYGGLLGGLTGVFIYCRQYRIPFSSVEDAVIPAIPLAHSVARIGCFCAGCCYGKTTDAAWGVIFKNSIGAPNGIKLIPTQLIESAGLFLIFLFLTAFFGRHAAMQKSFVLKNRTARKVSGKTGRSGAYRTLSFYLISYGALRFFIEFLRGDSIRGFLGPLSTSQWLSLIAITSWILLLRIRKSLSKEPAG